MKVQRKQKGFSLIELLIVVAIIVIIITMAIPKIGQAKMQANETSAVASLSAINRAQISYQTNYPTKGFADNLSALGIGALGANSACVPSPNNACLLDAFLSSGVKSGYRFAMQGGTPVNNINMTYGAGAAPLAYNSSGVRLFCTTEEQQIRFDANVNGSTSPPSPQQCVGGGFSPLG
jgi:type IV pilus assembly protein PilA